MYKQAFLLLHTNKSNIETPFVYCSVHLLQFHQRFQAKLYLCHQTATHANQFLVPVHTAPPEAAS